MYFLFFFFFFFFSFFFFFLFFFFLFFMIVDMVYIIWQGTCGNGVPIGGHQPTLQKPPSTLLDPLKASLGGCVVVLSYAMLVIASGNHCSLPFFPFHLFSPLFPFLLLFPFLPLFPLPLTFFLPHNHDLSSHLIHTYFIGTGLHHGHKIHLILQRIT
jgi:hypothetical protein